MCCPYSEQWNNNCIFCVFLETWDQITKNPKSLVLIVQEVKLVQHVASLVVWCDLCHNLLEPGIRCEKKYWVFDWRIRALCGRICCCWSCFLDIATKNIFLCDLRILCFASRQHWSDEVLNLLCYFGIRVYKWYSSESWVTFFLGKRLTGLLCKSFSIAIRNSL